MLIYQSGGLDHSENALALHTAVHWAKMGHFDTDALIG